MINIIETNLLSKKIVMSNLITEERAKEFLSIYENNNSYPERISYKIETTWGNTRRHV